MKKHNINGLNQKLLTFLKTINAFKKKSLNWKIKKNFGGKVWNRYNCKFNQTRSKNNKRKSNLWM